MTINDHMVETYEGLKRLVDEDGLPHSAIAGLRWMILEPAFAEDGLERRYKMTLGEIPRR